MTEEKYREIANFHKQIEVTKEALNFTFCDEGAWSYNMPEYNHAYDREEHASFIGLCEVLREEIRPIIEARIAKLKQEFEKL